jgi:uncharacterized oxidoreductase
VQISGNTVLITGGATGIGYAMAEEFLAAGSTVAICARREARLLEARTKHRDLHTFVCDIAKEAERRALVEWISTRFPALNILVNNAGIQRDIDFTHGIDEFLRGENEIRVNLEAPIVLSGLLIPLLGKNKNAAIINVSSGLGFVPAAQMPVYSASKAACTPFPWRYGGNCARRASRSSRSSRPRSTPSSISRDEPSAGISRLI